jgi:hypothetical protein
MNPLKVVVAALILLVNLVIAQPSWADPLQLTKSPEYTEVTKAIDSLLEAKRNPQKANGLTAESIEQQLGKLKLQRYILETAKDGAQCINQTGKTLAVYAHKAKKQAMSSALYYLGNGQATDDDWNCDGVYLPAGTKVASLSANEQDLTEPKVAQFVPGTQLIAAATPGKGAITFNIDPAKVLNVGEGDLKIPVLASTDIEAQMPNAPVED